MERFSSEIASISDDFELRQIQKITSMSGDISLSFQSEPSFFEAISVLGSNQDVIVIRDLEKNKIAGFMIVSIKRVFVNGTPTDVRYLSSVRLLEEYRGTRLLYKGFKYLENLICDRKLINITTIVEDNHQAIKVLSKSRAGILNYYPKGKLKSYVIKPSKRKRYKKKLNFNIQKGLNGFQLEEIISFINQEGSKKDFFPVYSYDTLLHNRLKDFNVDNIYIAYKESTILGVVGIWDQTNFKQIQVTNISRRMNVLKLFNNSVLSKMFDFPKIPDVNQYIVSLYLNLISVKNDDYNVFSSILDKISVDYYKSNYNYIMLGLSEKDPLSIGLKYFRNLEYNSLIYSVGREDLYVKERVPYLELSML